MIATLFVMFFQVAAGDPAVAAPPPAPPAPAAEAAIDPDSREARLKEIRERNKRVCRYEVELGSRLPKRLCRSAAQAQEATNDSRDWINRAQSQMPTKY